MNKIVAALVTLSCALTAHAQVPRTTIDGSADLREQASSPSARPNYGRLFTKTNGRLYYLKDDGTEYDVLSGGGGVMTGEEILDAIDELTGTLSLASDCTTLNFGGGSGSTGCTLDCATGELTCSVEIGGTMTGNEILSALLSVDGASSGLDADLLDGISSAAFATDAEVAAAYVLLTDYENADVLVKIVAVDGSGSGLDADLLDGVNGASYATDAEVTALLAGYVLSTDYEAADVLALLLTVDGPASALDADTLDGVNGASYATDAEVTALLADYVLETDYEAADVLALLLTVDGASSTLDADTLDTLSSSSFCQTSTGNCALADMSVGVGTAGTDAVITQSGITKTSAGAETFEIANFGAGSMVLLVNGLTVWTAGNDGPGSTLDADTVDGVQESALCLIDGSRSFTGTITTSGDVAVNGDDITCDSTTCSLYSTNATTVNIGDDATTINFNGGTASTGITMTNGSAQMTNLTLTGAIDVQSVLRNTAGANLEVDESNIRGTAALTITTQSNGNVTLGPGGTGIVILTPGATGIGAVRLNNTTVTSLPSTLCDADAEVSDTYRYSKSAGATISVCTCTKISSAYAFVASAGGDCT